MIRYISTRGPGEPKSFLDVMMAGLAPNDRSLTDDVLQKILQETYEGDAFNH